jgi:diguanylate cyclase (GGDEF)-like protein
MTTSMTEDRALDSALATLWQRHRQTNLDRISILEVTAANVLRSSIDEDGITEGTRAAHMLAGSLGTFGFDEGSRAALDAEYLLRQDEIDGFRLAEAVSALRASVQDELDASISVDAPASSAEPVPDSQSTVQVVSRDADLISRLTVAAAAVGLTVIPAAEIPSVAAMTALPASVLVDDDPDRRWTDSELLNSVGKLARRAMVFVLSDRDLFNDRVDLARVGASGVVPRSQSPRQIVSFLVETVARRRVAQSVVLSCNTDEALAATLTEALAGAADHLETCRGASALWEALEAQGSDLLLVGFDGPELSGPELCRVVRAHPRWHRLPIVVVGDRDTGDLEEAMAAGADDYLHSGISSRDLRARLHNILTTRRMAEVRSDIDPLTGTENRSAVERSLDRTFQLAMRRHQPFALGLVRADRFDQIRSLEGNAVADEALRRLGARLGASVPDASVVGRWTDSGFAVGMYGVASQDAAERISGVLQALAAEGVPTTSGHLAHFSFSAGVTSAPADGSSFSSLERMCESALQRATVGENRVVISGDRPPGHDEQVVDVVLVEDDDSVADVIEHALGLHQYGFTRFSDGAEAAGVLGAGRVKARVVLLDVGLPSLDGFGVLQVLRSKGILETTRVIMLTARSSEAEMLRALGLGAMEHITKPFSIPMLLGRLDQTRVKAAA